MTIEINKVKILENLMLYKRFSKKTELASYLEVKPNVVSNWFSRNSFDEKVIIQKFPEINKVWLLTGEGEMLNNTENEKPQLKINSEIPNGYYLPEVSASAGLEVAMENDDLKRIPVTIPGWEKDVIFINVYGDSMYPKYNAGEIIGIKHVELQYLQYGFPYVIVFNNGDVFVKYIKKGKDENHLLLVSENSFYESKEFHLELIKSFYSLKGVIKKEMM